MYKFLVGTNRIVFMLCFLLLDMVHSTVFMCVCMKSVKPVLYKVDLFLSTVVFVLHSAEAPMCPMVIGSSYT